METLCEWLVDYCVQGTLYSTSLNVLWSFHTQSLVDEGLFNCENPLHQYVHVHYRAISYVHVHRYTLYLVFGTLLRCDMEEFVQDWNSHTIRKNKLSKSPSGSPHDLYDTTITCMTHDHKDHAGVLLSLDSCYNIQKWQCFVEQYHDITQIMLTCKFLVWIGILWYIPAIERTNCSVSDYNWENQL